MHFTFKITFKKCVLKLKLIICVINNIMYNSYLFTSCYEKFLATLHCPRSSQSKSLLYARVAREKPASSDFRG